LSILTAAAGGFFDLIVLMKLLLLQLKLYYYTSYTPFLIPMYYVSLFFIFILGAMINDEQNLFHPPDPNPNFASLVSLFSLSFHFKNPYLFSHAGFD
jgi:hypothetical protein